MKNPLLLLLHCLAASLSFWICTSSVVAAPLVSIGDNTDIFFNGSSSLRWSSNLFRNENNEESDTSWIVSPGFEINVGRGISNADLTVVTRNDVVSYQDNDHLDTELFHIEALGSYETSRLNLNGSASFDEMKMNDGTNNVENDLVELNTIAGDLDAEYRVSPKFSFSAGVRYNETEYQTYNDLLADRETTSFPLSIYYELTPKLDLILGYTHSKTDIEGTSSRFPRIVESTLFPGTLILADTQIDQSGYERDSHFYNVGLRGNILTKLTGYFKIGYRTRSFEDSIRLVQYFDPNDPLVELQPPANSSTTRDDSGMFGLDANLTWMATTKLLVQLALSSDFGAGGEGESSEITRANLVGNYSFNTHWSAMANLGYTETDYPDDGRDEEQLTGGLRINYVLNTYWRFSAGYTYTDNVSSRDNSSYDNDTLDLTAILRY
ncbi:outer membrane beta-barrel protein [bacterium]|nr:outer membrane beta-barrel protein [bacterium]